MSAPIDKKALSRDLLAAWGNAIGHIEHKDGDLRFYVEVDISTYSSSIEVDHDESMSSSFVVKINDSRDVDVALAIAVFEAFDGNLGWSNDVLDHEDDYDEYQIACAQVIRRTHLAYRDQIAAIKNDLGDSLSIDYY